MSAFFNKPARTFFAIIFLMAGFLFLHNEARAATKTLYFRSTASTVVSGNASVDQLLETAGGADNTVTTVKHAKTTGTWQFIPDTSANNNTYPIPSTPNSKGWIWDGSTPGSFASATWTINVDVVDNSTIGTGVIKAQVWKVTANSTTVTQVTNLSGVLSSASFTPSTTQSRKTLTFTPSAFSLASGEYIYVETYLQMTVASNSNSSAMTDVMDSSSGTLQGSIVTSNFTPQDTTPPTPNPMSFATAPNNFSVSQIDMTATTASDPSAPISYYFTNNNSGCGGNAGAGGADLSWQTGTTYSNSGLQANKCYGYTVTARDSLSNTGTASGVSSTYTSANTPGTPTLGGATTNTLNLTNTENGNPASNPTTNFAVQVTTTTDSTWFNKWVDASGNASTTAVWMTDTQLDASVLHNLQPSTLYGVRVKARNQDTDETVLSAEGLGTTSNAPASGTVSANPTSCTISSGASTCTVPFTWSITNATMPNLFNASTSNQYSTTTSGSGVPYPITNGSNTIQVRDGSTVLASTTVTGSCAAGTTWNGASCAVVVIYYTITATAGSNGTTTPSGITNVAQGGSQAYTLIPDGGYTVATLTIDGTTSATTTTSYTFSNVQANHTISATFALIPITHTITSSAGSNGAIDPSGATPVNDGASQAFTITPDPGFYTATLTMDGGQVSTSSPYTFTNVISDHTIVATFSQIPTPPGSYAIIANQNPNGTVAPSGSSIVIASSSQTYTITPNAGYAVETLIIDSFSTTASTTYTFTNVQAPHTIEATFIALPVAEVPVISRRRLASITFSGKAFPGGKISVVQKQLTTENISKQQDITSIDGSFNIRFIDMEDGAYSFGLLIKDPEGRTSQTKFFLIDATRGDEVFKDIVAPPTIDIISGQVSRGGNIKVFGYASPGHTIRVYLNDILVKEVLAGRGGVYSFDLPTGALEFGQYKVRTKQINLDGGRESDFSTLRTVIVSKLAVVKADFSGDGKVDIKDWSIFLARWGAKSSLGREGIDLNSDGKVDIADFSIFIKTIRKK